MPMSPRTPRPRKTIAIQGGPFVLHPGVGGGVIEGEGGGRGVVAETTGKKAVAEGSAVSGGGVAFGIVVAVASGGVGVAAMGGGVVGVANQGDA